MMNQTQKHTTGKKLLALLLALIMTVSLLPMSVFAAEVEAEPDQAVIDLVGDSQSENGDNLNADDSAGSDADGSGRFDRKRLYRAFAADTAGK